MGRVPDGRARCSHRPSFPSPFAARSPDGQIAAPPVQPPPQKYSCSLFAQITSTSPASRPERGAYRDRHGRWVRDAVDAGGAADESAGLRTAKSCGPDAPTLASSSREARLLGGDGGKQARSPGRARRKPLKPLRREGRVFRWICGDYARVLYLFCTRGCGCNGHPAFPAPSHFEGIHSGTTRVRCAAGMRIRMLNPSS